MSIRSAALLALCGGLLVAGCAASEPPPNPEPPPRAAATPLAAPTPDEDALFEEQAKRAESLPARLALTPDHAAVARDRAPARLTPKAQADVDALPLPVLLLDDPDFLAGFQLVSGPDWYTASAHHDGLHIAVRGVSFAFDRPEIAEELGKDFDPTALHASESDHIHTVAFMRYNLPYTLTLECAQPGNDPRCASPDHALSLARRLVLMGGQP